jgi:transcription antitermination factor NusG
MVRALGDRSADGASFAAEEIVTGAFQTSAGTVKSVDTAKNAVVITDMATKADVTVDLSLATML